MHSVWYGKLERILQEEITKQGRDILEGSGVTFEMYRYHVGYFQGLQAALRLAEEVDNEQLGISNAAVCSSP